MPELARGADGVINRSSMREIPHSPVALYKAANLFGTLIAETILASVHVRARKQAGHMDASDLINAAAKHLARRRPSTYGEWCGDSGIGFYNEKNARQACNRTSRC